MMTASLIGCCLNEIGTNKSDYRVLGYDELKPVEGQEGIEEGD